MQVRLLGAVTLQRPYLLVLEYMDAGSLHGLLEGGKVLDPPLAKQLAGDVLHGLEYLHSMNIIHRDMKPENVLLTCRDGQLRAKIAGKHAPV
jgi:serine/threonine protein kinase